MSLGIHYNSAGEDLTSYISNPEVWNVRDGHIDLPSGPGLGIEVDEVQIRERSIGSKAWVTPEFRGPCGELREW